MTTERTEDSAIGKILRRNIDRLLGERGWMPKTLYEALEMSASNYSQMFKRKDAGPQMATLIKIAEALGCKPSELIE